MARYIDADALKLDIDLSKGASVLDMAIGVIKAVQEAPTVDVVPKSEVAREIFEKIEKTIIDSSHLPKCCRFIDIDELEELKKKYMES